MKKQNPKNPAAKPAKTPKPPLPPNAWESFSRTLPEPEAIIAEALAIIHAVDAAAKPPFSLPSIPPALAGAVRPLLAAARLPAGALPPTVARLAARLEEWDRRMGDDSATDAVCESVDELDRREFRLDPNAYRRAELARVSARVTADALRAFRRLSPEAARAASEEARPRFADAGAAVLEYLAAPLPGMDAEEVFLSRIEDALAALADAVRNPATPAASPSNPADAETVARIEEKVEALGAPVSALVEERRAADARDAAVEEQFKSEAFETWAGGFNFATPGGPETRWAKFVAFCGGESGRAFRGVERTMGQEDFERRCQNMMRNLRRRGGLEDVAPFEKLRAFFLR